MWKLQNIPFWSELLTFRDIFILPFQGPNKRVNPNMQILLRNAGVLDSGGLGRYAGDKSDS
jgi:hypothetical protein